MADVSFGEWLKRRRKAKGWTQEQLAEQVNCSTIMLRKIEGEERRPSVQIVERLAKIFQIPTNEQASFLRFARGDWQSVPSDRIEDAPWRASTASPRSNLPASLTSLIGREKEIALVHEYLLNPNIRLVTLIGPPGIGKTRLSIEAAREALSDFANDIFFVALAPLEDSGLVASTVGQTLRFERRGHTSAVELLQDSIADKQMLLVLDNFEHLLDAAPLIPELLTACPKLKILVTSREALRVPGEWQYAVPPLTVPRSSPSKEMDLWTTHDFSALTLFEERARAVRSDFKLNHENANVVAAICTRLDGLPLAIELIAARVRLMSPQDLLSRMDDRFTLYADGMRAVSERQKTLHNAIAWSYDLLSSEEQRLFAYLAVFAGGFTLEAASQITGNPDVLNGISALADKNLLQRVIDERGEARFTMLSTIREFALNRLADMGETERLRDLHLNFFVTFAEQAEFKFFTSDQPGWYSQLGAEIDNLRNAMKWSMMSDTAETSDVEGPRLQAGLRLAGALYWVWDDRDYPDETSGWVRSVLSRSKQPTAARARALLSLGVLLSTVNNFTAARPYVEEALSICRQLNDPLLLAWSLTYRGAIDEAQADYISAQSYIEQSLEIAETLKIGPLIGWNLTLLADTLYMQGDHAGAKELYQRSVEFIKEIRQRDILAYPLRRLGYLAMNEGNTREAAQRFRESLELNTKSAFQYGITASLTAFARLAIAQQKLARAAQIYGILDRRLESSAYRLYLVDEVEYNRGLTAIQSYRNQKTLAEARAKGKRTLTEEVVAFVLEDTSG